MQLQPGDRVEVRSEGEQGWSKATYAFDLKNDDHVFKRDEPVILDNGFKVNMVTVPMAKVQHYVRPLGD